jgi:hypothetical protein
VTTNFNQQQRFNYVELYLHSPKYLDKIVLNSLSSISESPVDMDVSAPEIWTLHEPQKAK